MDKIVIPDAAIREWNARYYPEGNKVDTEHFNCQHCGELVSEDGAPFPVTCFICQSEIDADNKYDEMRSLGEI